MPHLITLRPVQEQIHGEENEQVNLILGDNEIYLSPLLFAQSTPITRSIDHDLRYRVDRRGVIQPIPTQLPRGHDHPWGPTSIIVGNMGPFALTFLEIHCPATSPPVSRMIILTPKPWRDIIILPAENTDFVTVADVQKGVVEWMKEVAAAFLRNESATLSEMFSISMPDGDEVEVELWAWRGLKRHGLESDMWELFL